MNRKQTYGELLEMIGKLNAISCAVIGRNKLKLQTEEHLKINEACQCLKEVTKRMEQINSW